MTTNGRLWSVADMTPEEMPRFATILDQLANYVYEFDERVIHDKELKYDTAETSEEHHKFLWDNLIYKPNGEDYTTSLKYIELISTEDNIGFKIMLKHPVSDITVDAAVITVMKNIIAAYSPQLSSPFVDLSNIEVTPTLRCLSRGLTNNTYSKLGVIGSPDFNVLYNEDMILSTLYQIYMPTATVPAGHNSAWYNFTFRQGGTWPEFMRRYKNEDKPAKVVANFKYIAVKIASLSEQMWVQVQHSLFYSRWALPESRQLIDTNIVPRNSSDQIYCLQTPTAPDTKVIGIDIEVAWLFPLMWAHVKQNDDCEYITDTIPSEQLTKVKRWQEALITIPKTKLQALIRTHYNTLNVQYLTDMCVEKFIESTLYPILSYHNLSKLSVEDLVSTTLYPKWTAVRSLIQEYINSFPIGTDIKFDSGVLQSQVYKVNTHSLLDFFTWANPTTTRYPYSASDVLPLGMHDVDVSRGYTLPLFIELVYLYFQILNGSPHEGAPPPPVIIPPPDNTTPDNTTPATPPRNPFTTSIPPSSSPPDNTTPTTSDNTTPTTSDNTTPATSDNTTPTTSDNTTPATPPSDNTTPATSSPDNTTPPPDNTTPATPPPDNTTPPPDNTTPATPPPDNTTPPLVIIPPSDNTSAPPPEIATAPIITTPPNDTPQGESCSDCRKIFLVSTFTTIALLSATALTMIPPPTKKRRLN